jgi:glycine cleavage system H protein
LIWFTAKGYYPKYLCAMNSQNAANKDLYYTSDHEWINFKGSIAYTGICSFKLLGFKEIQQLNFSASPGFLKRGDLIATIRFNDYQIEARMPVDGNVVELNDALINGDPNTLLKYAESSGWIAMIAPSKPYERKGLLLPKQYQMNGKSKYAKQ